jgi:hypothetical protein
MFIEEGSALIGVAPYAGFMAESAHPLSRGWCMRIMACRALQYSFLEPVSLVEHEFTVHIFMTGYADLVCAFFDGSGFHQFVMTIGAIHSCLSMGAGKESSSCSAVAVQTLLCFRLSMVCFAEGEYRSGSTAFLDVHGGIAMTVCTECFLRFCRIGPGSFFDSAVTHEFEVSTDIIVTFGTNAKFRSFFLNIWIGCR